MRLHFKNYLYLPTIGSSANVLVGGKNISLNKLPAPRVHLVNFTFTVMRSQNYLDSWILCR